MLKVGDYVSLGGDGGVVEQSGLSFNEIDLAPVTWVPEGPCGCSARGLCEQHLNGKWAVVKLDSIGDIEDLYSRTGGDASMTGHEARAERLMGQRVRAPESELQR